MEDKIKRSNLFKTAGFPLLGIILLGLLLRLIKITSPLLDLYPVKQELCAMIARNFFRGGYNFLRPEVDWFGTFDSLWRLEFPLISYLTSLLYSLFGIHEFLGRVVSIIFSIGGIYLIFDLTKRLLNLRCAIYAAFFFAISPMGVYFGRTFMPEMSMMFFSIASIYYFYRWIESEDRLHYILAILNTAFVFLTKLPTLYLGLPLFYLAYSKYGKKVFFQFSLYLFFLLAVLPALFWYRQASNDMFSFYVANKYYLMMLLRPVFYRRIFESISLLILTPVGAFLALFGLFLSVDKKREYFVHFWLLSVVAYTLAAPQANYIHYYYQLPILPCFCIFAAKTLDKLNNSRVWRYTIFSRLNSNFVIWSIIFTILVAGFLIIKPFYKLDYNTYKASKVVKELTKPDTIVIAGLTTYNAPLYYTDRKGFQTNVEPMGSMTHSWATTLNKYNLPEKRKGGIALSGEIELVNFLIRYGADIYFTTNMEVFEREKALREYMYKNFKLLKKEDGFIIFSLKKK